MPPSPRIRRCCSSMPASIRNGPCRHKATVSGGRLGFRLDRPSPTADIGASSAASTAAGGPAGNPLHRFARRRLRVRRRAAGRPPRSRRRPLAGSPGLDRVTQRPYRRLCPYRCRGRATQTDSELQLRLAIRPADLYSRPRGTGNDGHDQQRPIRWTGPRRGGAAAAGSAALALQIPGHGAAAGRHRRQPGHRAGPPARSGRPADEP